MLLGACGWEATPTPTDERGPILPASPTVLPISPTEPPDLAVGRSEPTSAGLAAEGEPVDGPGGEAVQPTLEAFPLQAIAGDGTIVQVVFYGALGAPAPNVILLHDADQSGSEWDNFAPLAQRLGYNVFAPDQRGYGRTGGPVDWAKAAEDVPVMIEMIDRLENVSSGQYALIGTGIGADVALVSCAQLATCGAVVVISPREAAAGLAAAAALSERSVLIVSADDDPGATTTAEQLNGALTGDHAWQRYSSGGRGSELMRTQPDLAQRILEWLQVRMAPRQS